MKPVLVVGITKTRRIVVDMERTIGFMGEDLRVYSTPMMVNDVENACLDFLQEHLTDDKSSVGAHVEIDHFGPTLIGMWVDITMRMTGIDGRKVSFEAEVRDALDVVGKMKHVRVVIDLAKQKERLQAKAFKLAQLAS